MGTIAIQNQCCLSKRDDEQEDSDDGSAQEGTAAQLVDSVPWSGRVDGKNAALPACPWPATMSRSLSESTTIVPQQQASPTAAR